MNKKQVIFDGLAIIILLVLLLLVVSCAPPLGPIKIGTMYEMFYRPPLLSNGQFLQGCAPNTDERLMCCSYHNDKGDPCIILCDFPDEDYWRVLEFKCHSWSTSAKDA